MASVSVEKSAVVKAIQICNVAIQELQHTSDSLQRKYQQAGTGWKDSKYQQLGVIVTNCNTALKNPVSGLQDCIVKLTELEKRITEYENVNL